MIVTRKTDGLVRPCTLSCRRVVFATMGVVAMEEFR